jgi:hypothetical protein
MGRLLLRAASLDFIGEGLSNGRGFFSTSISMDHKGEGFWDGENEHFYFSPCFGNICRG